MLPTFVIGGNGKFRVKVVNIKIHIFPLQVPRCPNLIQGLLRSGRWREMCGSQIENVRKLPGLEIGCGWVPNPMPCIIFGENRTRSQVPAIQLCIFPMFEWPDSEIPRQRKGKCFCSSMWSVLYCWYLNTRLKNWECPT